MPTLSACPKQVLQGFGEGEGGVNPAHPRNSHSGSGCSSSRATWLSTLRGIHWEILGYTSVSGESWLFPGCKEAPAEILGLHFFKRGKLGRCSLLDVWDAQSYTAIPGVHRTKRTPCPLPTSSMDTSQQSWSTSFVMSIGSPSTFRVQPLHLIKPLSAAFQSLAVFQISSSLLCTCKSIM